MTRQHAVVAQMGDVSPATLLRATNGRSGHVPTTVGIAAEVLNDVGFVLPHTEVRKRKERWCQRSAGRTERHHATLRSSIHRLKIFEVGFGLLRPARC